MSIVSRAEAVWNGDLASGSGVVSAASSGAFTSLPVSWSSRTESHQEHTSPEELVAAAHASCYAMAFSAGLAGLGHSPEHLHVSAEVTFGQIDGGWKVTSSALSVQGKVPGIDLATFQKVADDAGQGCPISHIAGAGGERGDYRERFVGRVGAPKLRERNPESCADSSP